MSGIMSLKKYVCVDLQNHKISGCTRLKVYFVFLCAKILSCFRPCTIRTFISAMSKGCRIASTSEANKAYFEITSILPNTRGNFACLNRSLSVIMLLKTRKLTATWCVGVSDLPPFSAHAWVTVGEEVIGENVKFSSLVPLIQVPKT